MTDDDRVICPNCGSEGFDGQGMWLVGDTPMYRRRCHECATEFAVEDRKEDDSR